MKGSAAFPEKKDPVQKPKQKKSDTNHQKIIDSSKEDVEENKPLCTSPISLLWFKWKQQRDKRIRSVQHPKQHHKKGKWYTGTKLSQVQILQPTTPRPRSLQCTADTNTAYTVWLHRGATPPSFNLHLCRFTQLRLLLFLTCNKYRVHSKTHTNQNQHTFNPSHPIYW